MKIRSDFVTNSSSSSFILTLTFELRAGNKLVWRGTADCGEGAWEYICLSARKSPKELGEAEGISELVEMVQASIGEGLAEDGDELSPVIGDSDEVIVGLQNLSSMGDISKIIIEGYEDSLHDYDDCGPYASDEIVTYDMASKKQSSVHYGCTYLETEGTGGKLEFKRKTSNKNTPDGWFERKRAEFQSETEFDFDKEDEE